MCCASGWRLGAGCLNPAGRLTCPRCDREVTALAVRAGVIEVATHPPAQAVVCTGCGTTHDRLACPTCAQRVDAGDELALGLLVVPGPALAVIARRVAAEAS